MPPLVIAVHDVDDGVRRLELAGAIDVAGADRVTTAIERAVVVNHVNELVIDLAAVTCLGAAAVTALATGHSVAIEHGTAYRVINARTGLHPVLDLTGVLAT